MRIIESGRLSSLLAISGRCAVVGSALVLWAILLFWVLGGAVHARSYTLRFLQSTRDLPLDSGDLDLRRGSQLCTSFPAALGIPKGCLTGNPALRIIKNVREAAGARYVERLPRTQRRELGKFYTPPEIVDFILEAVGWSHGCDIVGKRIADLSCGCGAFLVPAAQVLAAKIRTQDPTLDLAEQLTESIWGFEIDPAALRSCRQRLRDLAGARVWPVGSCFRADAVAWLARDRGCHPGQPRLPGTCVPLFDFVVGNPPYVQIFDVDRKETLSLFDSTRGNFDLHAAFLEMGLDSLSEHGSLGYLIPNSFLTGSNYRRLRERLMDTKKGVRFFDFGPQQLFCDASVHCAVLVARPSRRRQTFSYCRATLEKSRVVTRRPKRLAVPLFLGGSSLACGDRLLRRILRRSTHCLGDVLDTKDVGINYSTKGRNKVRDGSVARKILYEGGREDEKDHPVIRGRDIERYSIRFRELWLRHDWRTRLAEGESVSFGEAHFPAGSKIVSRQTADSIIAAIDRSRLYCARTVHIGLHKRAKWELELILAFMNSSVSTYFYRAISGEEGRVFPQVKIGKLRQVPLIEPDESVKREMIELVTRIEASGSQRAHVRLTEVFGELWGMSLPIDGVKQPSGRARPSGRGNGLPAAILQI
jgi:hypothetical protein